MCPSRRRHRQRRAQGGEFRPLADDIGLVADGTPYADAADVFAGPGAVEMVAPPFEHRLAAARPTKQEGALLARNVDLHFVHRKGAFLAKRLDMCPAPAVAMARRIVSDGSFLLLEVGCRLVIVALGASPRAQAALPALPRAQAAPPTPRGCDRFLRTPRS